MTHEDEAWKARFVDMQFDEHEATAWEKLVAHGMTQEDATTEIVRRRPGGKKTYAADPKPTTPPKRQTMTTAPEPTPTASAAVTGCDGTTRVRPL